MRAFGEHFLLQIYVYTIFSVFLFQGPHMGFYCSCIFVYDGRSGLRLNDDTILKPNLIVTWAVGD